MPDYGPIHFKRPIIEGRIVGNTYAASEVLALLARGPSEGEDFFRLKVTGNGETKWVNVSPDQLAKIANVLDDPREERS